MNVHVCQLIFDKVYFNFKGVVSLIEIIQKTTEVRINNIKTYYDDSDNLHLEHTFTKSGFLHKIILKYRNM